MTAIEDYAIIGDCRSAALVSRGGAIDWLCWPRFDSGACLAALLGTPEHGSWSLAPAEAITQTSRRYRGDTLILETEFATATGRVRLIDFMAISDDGSHLIRLVEGVEGRVAMRLFLALRFDYGAIVPWVHRLADGSGISATAGPDRVTLRTQAPIRGEGLTTVADFDVLAGQTVPFVMSWGQGHLPPPASPDPLAALAATAAYWADWSQRCPSAGRHAADVRRSLLTLKALTYQPTGGIVAAPTTSLPEALGGSRNWDYRYCWLRDASLTLMALIAGGHTQEALAWRDWLLRAVAGSPEQVQIMYGVAGERRLIEWEAAWLPGYQGARPVRIGNAASHQLQLDVFGEVASMLHMARETGLVAPPSSWDLQLKLTEHLAGILHEPDEGIWEVRGGRRHFTHSKVMAWVALDRAMASAGHFGLPAPLERWKALRDGLHADICSRGFSTRRNSFVQSYGSEDLDASLLLIPAVGFLPPDDPRVRGTIAAIEAELMIDGLVQRYDTRNGADGLSPGEGAFLPCSFWLVDCYVMQGRLDEANALFDRLLSLRNDLGLLSEEYDTRAGRQVGNFPQAWSHVALINSALLLDRAG